MRLLFTITITLFGLCIAAASAGSLDKMERAPAAWRGPVFKPNYRFPAKFETIPEPWAAISFRHEPERYLRTLLHYALEGQDRIHWRLQNNTLRNWYHVPWLGPGANGREFIHGLTRAGDLQPGALGPAQTACRQNWALAFYNQSGGAVLGHIWGHGKRDPDLSALPFPPGTVAVKLVFTSATANDDPGLAGAPELVANIHADAGPNPNNCAPAIRPNGYPAARKPHTLRLIQFDIAVREQRASYKTGWVFGSFRYDGKLPSDNAWEKLVPMGLMWGNDPLVTDAGEKPRQSIVFKGYETLGRGGRMNGIVDDRASACSSCHMAAQWPSVAPMTAPVPWSEARCWFRNVDARYPFGFPPGQKNGCGDPSALEKLTALDFSLQLTIALRNWSLERLKHRTTARSKLGSLKRLANGNLTANGLTVVPLRQ